MPAPRPISLDQIIELNEEIAALISAGVPLELGLRQLGWNLHGSLSRIVRKLSSRLEQGLSLPEALAETREFPEIYSAVTVAGLRAGRLPAAVEALTNFARAALDLRRRITLACLYPAMVVLLAYALFLGLITLFIPALQETYRMFNFHESWLLNVMQGMGETVLYWGWILPAVMLVLALRWVWAGRSAFLMSHRPSSPLYGAIIRPSLLGNFAELTALLVEHGVPLPESLELASRATGDARIIAAAGQLAADHRRGEPIPDQLRRGSDFPPFLRWILQSMTQPSLLAESLRHAADFYRRRALDRTEWLRVILPALLVVVVGGGATFFYALTLFLPLQQMLFEISR